MATHQAQFESSDAAVQATHRAWTYGFGVSTAVHVGVLLCLSLIAFAIPATLDRDAIDTRWDDKDVEAPIELHAIDVRPAEAETDAAGGHTSVSNLSQRVAIHRAVSMRSPQIHGRAAALPFEAMFCGDELAATVGPSATPFFEQRHGSGQGDVDGNGNSGGFFSTLPKGKRIVYVVDCSMSMNHPDESDARTRFRRVKFELIKSVSSMSEDSSFFIIYFNEFAHPMPARSIQRATPAAKRRYLEWAANFRAIGETDPREALKLAIKLRPEVIYFLTDGVFLRKIARDLQLFSQDGVTINTFAMGNQEAAPLMQEIANTNRGVYHFVP